MFAHDETRTMVLRGIQAEIQKELIAKKSPATEATDDEALAIVKRLVKQHKDSIEQFTKGGRPELAADEDKELFILQHHFPCARSRIIAVVSNKNIRIRNLRVNLTEKLMKL